VAEVDGVVQINAGQECKHIGLDDRNQQFERVERDVHRHRQHRDRRPDAAGEAEADDEAGEHLEQDVACRHVGEKTNRQGQRTRQERDAALTPESKQQ
jgi:hypothetical protein